MQTQNWRMRRLVASGMLPDRAGQPARVWAHISLADLMVLDADSALQAEWIAPVRAQWAAARAAASVGGGDGAAWLEGKAAQGFACDASITPVVTGEVNPAVLEDLVRLCVELAGHGPGRCAPAEPHGRPRAAAGPGRCRPPSAAARRWSRPSSAKPRFFYCTLDRRLRCGNVHDEDIASLRHHQPAVLFWRIPAVPRLHVPRLDPGLGLAFVWPGQLGVAPGSVQASSSRVRA